MAPPTPTLVDERSAAGSSRRLTIELITTSLSPTSVSARLLARVRQELGLHPVTVGWTDLRHLPPARAGQKTYPPEYVNLKDRVRAADAVVIAHGIHGFSVPGPTKTLTDILAADLVAKAFAIVTAAGSMRSHLAIRDLACSLVMENQSLWLPLTVQVSPDLASPDVDPVENQETQRRVLAFVDGVLDYAARLSALVPVR